MTFIFLNLNGTRAIADAKPQNDDTTNSVKQYITAGEFVSPVLLQRIRKYFPQAAVCQIYGQTEASGFTTIFAFNDLEDRHLLETRPASCGRPMPGLQYKIVDVETEEALGPNQEGELRIKSKFLMNGYYNMDSTSAFDDEGYLKTGDLVYFDEEFCFYVVDRIKELLKYRGWHVAPQMIEKVLVKHEAVSAAVVIGVPDEEDGEHPMAYVILKGSCNLMEEDLRSFVDENVDERKKLRGGVKFIDSFPRTATGKINRRLLKQLHGNK